MLRNSAVVLATAALALLTAPAGAAAAPGDLDPTFGTGGVTSLASGSELNGVAVQSNGQVVAVGDAGTSLLVQRFSASGTPETPFAGGSGVGRGVAIQSDGKIVVGGYDGAGMLVERFNSNGTLDSGFGSGGVVHAVPGGRANAVALGPAGTIVAAGQVPGADGFQHLAMLRLSSSGSPDGTFGAGGLAVPLSNPDSIAKGVVVQGDGKVVIAGSIGPGTIQQVVGLVARTTPAGALDPTFGAGGIVIQSAQGGGAAASLNAIALDPAGGIVVAGGGTTTNQAQALFARLTCGGALDGTFNGTGLELTPSSKGFVTEPIGANGVGVAAGRRMVGSGAYRDSGLTSAGLWGFEPSGSLHFANTVPSSAQGNAVAIGVQGNIVVAGSNVPAGLAPSGFVARYIGFGTPASGNSGACGGSFVSPGGPPASAPSVTTGSTSGIGATAASLSGSVNPNGQTTSYYFQWGTSTTYGSQTPTGSAGAGSVAVAVAATLSGLKPGTTYHYRLVASNATGTTIGADARFTTPSSKVSKPSLSRVGQSSTKWGEAQSTKHARPVGTTFSFTLNVAARVTFAFSQAASGRKVNGRCVAQTNQNKGKPSCKRTVSKGSISVNGHAGKNTLSFSGRISRSNKLKTGTYTVTITATDAAGRSRSQSLTFTIVS